MNYEKGEQIKSVEEFVKEVLAKDKPYYFYDTYRDTSKATYYHIYHEDVEWGNLFHAILKKEKVKFWKFVNYKGEDVDGYYVEDLSKVFIGKSSGKSIIHVTKGKGNNEYLSWTKSWTKTNCFIEVEV